MLSHIRHMPNRKAALARLEAADFGFLTATLWPDESRDNLKILSYTLIWLCLWADGVANQLASPAYGSDVHTYRQETLDFAAEALRLTDLECTSQDVLITSIMDVIDPVSDLEERQRKQLYGELELYIRATAVEQDRQVRRWLPSVDDYLQVRLSTSSVGFLSVLHGMLIGRHDYEAVNSQMVEMMFLVNMMTTISNDVLSLKEEIAADTTYSLVPVLWNETRSLQGAINRSYRMLEDARERFDQLEADLLEERDDVPLAAIERYIRVCQTYCTGSLAWGMRSCEHGMQKLDGAQEGKYQVRL